jgi:hypothetical protein
MISHLNGGNTAQRPTGHPEPDWTGVGWDGTLLDLATPVPFTQAVLGARLLTRCGARPVMAAAAVQRAWFAERRAARCTVAGVPDEFVNAVRGVIAEAAL